MIYAQLSLWSNYISYSCHSFYAYLNIPTFSLSISPAKKEQLGTDEKQHQKKKVKELKVLDAKISQNLCK